MGNAQHRHLKVVLPFKGRNDVKKVFDADFLLSYNIYYIVTFRLNICLLEIITEYMLKFTNKNTYTFIQFRLEGLNKIDLKRLILAWQNRPSVLLLNINGEFNLETYSRLQIM